MASTPKITSVRSIVKPSGGRICVRRSERIVTITFTCSLISTSALWLIGRQKKISYTISHKNNRIVICTRQFTWLKYHSYTPLLIIISQFRECRCTCLMWKTGYKQCRSMRRPFRPFRSILFYFNHFFFLLFRNKNDEKILRINLIKM